MSAATELYDSIPDYVALPPIECVVFGWGVNEDGLSGDNCIQMPRVIECLLGTRLRGRALGCNPLVAGSRNTLVISQDGTVWSWGWNDRGTLGRGKRSDENPDQPTVGLRNKCIVQAAIGGWHCLAVDRHGRVYAWGGNEYMQCAMDTTVKDIWTPVHIVTDLVVKQVACGGMHSLVLTRDGDVWTWGEPWGDFSMTLDRTPRCVRSTGDTVMIACGDFHNMVLDSDGHVYTWGINDYGQLGHGSTKYCTTPSRVADLDDVSIVDISAGGWHSVAVSKEGVVYIWGRGEHGRLGLADKTGSSRLRPEQVPGLGGHRIVQSSAGGTHTMCLTDDGIIFVWGRGSFGRLGSKTTVKNRYTPHKVDLPGGARRWRVLSIACGGRHSLCLAQPLDRNSCISPPPSEGSKGDDEESDDSGCSTHNDAYAVVQQSINTRHSTQPDADNSDKDNQETFDVDQEDDD